MSIPVLEAFEANVVEDAMTRCSRWNIGLKSFFRLDPDSPDVSLSFLSSLYFVTKSSLLRGAM